MEGLFLEFYGILTKFQAQPASTSSEMLLFWEQLTSSERVCQSIELFIT